MWRRLVYLMFFLFHDPFDRRLSLPVGAWFQLEVVTAGRIHVNDEVDEDDGTTIRIIRHHTSNQISSSRSRQVCKRTHHR
jgi:hypothetical protein